jgi:hypothetical protein
MLRNHVLTIVLLTLVLFGCGPRHIQYRAVVDRLECAGDRAVAVAVLDTRPYIRNKERDPSYVGVLRGGYGNPFVERTVSGAPLADDMLVTIGDSLRARGFAIVALQTSLNDTPASVMTQFGAASAQRLVLLELNEWRSDYLPKAYTPERSNLFIDVKMTVLDQKKKQLTAKQLREDLTLPSGWPAHTVPNVYQEKIRQLFNDPNVCKALR